MKELTTVELRKEQLRILDAIAAFCKEKNLRCYLFAGTLIGAVRHQGYIPWDDDLDICMLRADYDRFLREFPDNGDFWIACADNTPGYYLAAAKVVSKRTVLMEQVANPIPLGVNVDVFPIDALPDSDKELHRLNQKISKYRNLLLLKNTLRSADRSKAKNAVLAVSQLLSRPLSTAVLLRKIDKLARSYSGMPGCSRVGDISVFTYGMREVFSAAVFSDTVSLPYEGKEYPAPSGYHDLLSRMYGDYMKLPPAEKQITHHAFTAYWKEERTE
ncbi:MAG: LicD family protein [Candidatus Faecousia sp.]|nr:LicD family protein [Candidatus Faecousia sp.]